MIILFRDVIICIHADDMFAKNGSQLFLVFGCLLLNPPLPPPPTHTHTHKLTEKLIKTQFCIFY